jgi:hypothetical protein
MENQLIIMTNKEVQKYDIIKNLINKKLTGIQVAKQLSLSTRQVKRIKKKVKEQGIKGIVHRNRGKESRKKIPKLIKAKVINLIETNYSDFTPTLIQEKLLENHSIKISYGSVRNIMLEEGLYKIKKRKSNKKYFSQRPRKEYFGELIQFDGSYHNWLEGRASENEQCLLLAVDDATGDITPKLDKNEGIQAVFSFWKEYLKKQGKPKAIYLDKFSTYKINHKNAVDNQDFKTQFQRAMQELDVEVIFANTPQAKGRVERMNRTLQDRMIKEMRLAKINKVKDANEFMKKEFNLKFNQKFSVKPRKKQDLHRKLTNQERKKLANIFSIKNQRIVKNDFTIQYLNRCFQLDQTQPTTVFRKNSVTIEEHLDKTIHICKKDIYLNFKELAEKPVKEIDLKLAAITPNRIQYTPPVNHPWRSFQFSKKQEKVKVFKN